METLLLKAKEALLLLSPWKLQDCWCDEPDHGGKKPHTEKCAYVREVIAEINRHERSDEEQPLLTETPRAEQIIKKAHTVVDPINARVRESEMSTPGLLFDRVYAHLRNVYGAEENEREIEGSTRYIHNLYTGALLRKPR